MKINERLKEKLISNGMFESQADKVIEATVANTPDMDGNWDKDESYYPTFMMTVL